jgi:hypothetical protein
MVTALASFLGSPDAAADPFNRAHFLRIAGSQ